MGILFSFFSSSSPAPRTTDTNEILNYILSGLIENVDMEDLSDLADPKKCSKYVIFGAEALDKLFQKLDLQATTSKEETIYFEKTSKIEGKLKGSAQHRENCKEIAKFFSEIMQLFSLVILGTYNTKIPVDNIRAALRGGGGQVDTIGGKPYNKKDLLGQIIFKYFETRPDDATSLYLKDAFDPVRINPEVGADGTVVQPIPIGYNKVQAAMRLEGSNLIVTDFRGSGRLAFGDVAITLPLTQSKDGITCSLPSKPAEKFYRCLTYAFVKTIYDAMPAEQPSTFNYLVGWGLIPKTVGSGFTAIKGSDLFVDGLSILSDRLTIFSKGTSQFCELSIRKAGEAAGFDYNVELSNVGKQRAKSDSVRRAKFSAASADSAPTYQERSIPAFIMANFQLAVNAMATNNTENNNNTSILQTAQPRAPAPNVQKLKKLLIDRNTVPMCNAYAKILMETLRSNDTALLCKRDFRRRLGVPINEERVSQSKAMSKVWRLFLETGDETARKLSGDPTWGQFKKYMYDLEDLAKEPACRTVTINPNTERDVRGIIDDLIRSQYEFNAEVFEEVVWRIFDEESATKKEGFKFNPDVFEGGRRYLNELRRKTADLFASNFIDCEKMYYEGANLVLGNRTDDQ